MNQQPLIPHGAPISDSSSLLIRPPERLWDRDAVIAALHRDLKVGTAVLLHGPAGIGKTAIAAALAADYTANGVLWIEATNDSIQSLLNRTARAYGLDPASLAVDALENEVRDLLHDHRPFIVLDGQVNVDAAREFVRGSASGIPLVLTQTKLAAGPWTPYEIGPLSTSAAAALLGSSTPEAARLVEILAGYPLALNIARRHLAMKGLNPPDFWAQIPQNTANPAAGAIMAAYRLLPSALQGMVLLIGAAFTESISEGLLSDVAGAPVTALRPAVAQLTARGLAAERDGHCTIIHELVQAFAQTSLGAKKQTMQGRHLRAVVAYAQRYADQPERLADEIETILAAGVYAAQNHQPDMVRSLISALDNFASVRGFTQEIAWLERLIDEPELADLGFLGEREPIIPAAATVQPQVVEEKEPPREAIPQPEAARSQQPVVAAAPAEAVEDLTLPVEEAIRPAPPETEGPTLLVRGQEAAQRGDLEEATSHYTQAVESYRANGSIEDELAALQALAQLNLQQENVAGVLDYVDKGMTLAQQADNPRREGELLIVLGDLQTKLGRYEGAEDAYREAINALRPIEAWDDIADSLQKLGDVYLLQDRRQDAASVWEQTLPIYERSKRQSEAVDMLSQLSDLYADQLQWREAMANRTRALEKARESGDAVLIYDQLSSLGALLEDSGDRTAAIAYYQQALHLAFQINDTERLGETLLALGRTQIDDSVQLNRVVQFLEAAQQYLPGDTDIQRLLKRAKTRQERLMNAGVTMVVADESLEEYAARLVSDGSGANSGAD